MLDAVVSEHGQCSGYTDAVVGTEGGAIGLEPLAVDDEADGVGKEVVVHSLVALAHHIHV